MFHFMSHLFYNVLGFAGCMQPPIAELGGSVVVGLAPTKTGGMPWSGLPKSCDQFPQTRRSLRESQSATWPKARTR
ncbi:hypothetical protein SBV1_910014 [Verrucomicrobia bacterium]|nr:hypothetical protein SBV1_910014 [Verrucomicrobiota bacterium]